MPAPAPRRRGDRAAVCAQLAQLPLLTDGHQIAQDQGPAFLFPVCPQVLGVDVDRRLTVIPWLPLPELMTTGRSQPAMAGVAGRRAA